jgi:hypothetical protein
MAQKPDSLAFRFAVVLALAVIVLLITTWAAPPANDTAAPIRSDAMGSTFEPVLERLLAPLSLQVAKQAQQPKQPLHLLRMFCSLA